MITNYSGRTSPHVSRMHDVQRCAVTLGCGERSSEGCSAPNSDARPVLALLPLTMPSGLGRETLRAQYRDARDLGLRGLVAFSFTVRTLSSTAVVHAQLTHHVELVEIDMLRCD